MIDFKKIEKFGIPALVIAATLAGASSTQAYAAQGSRYEINNGEVYDKDKNLTWQRCSLGQNWKEGKGCEGTINTYTFQEALQQAGTKWRLPTKDELSSLVDKSRPDFPAIDSETFPGMNENVTGYWSNTPYNTERSWNVRFTSGIAADDINVRRFGVRLVRSGK